MTVDILGVPYTIQYLSEEEDSELSNCATYCDKYDKKIVISSEKNSNGNLDPAKKVLLRHEIIHAFFFESGLDANWNRFNWGVDETTVDWIALQFPKLLNAFEKVGAI